MRKLVLALAVAGLLALAPTVMAAVGARLAGTFDVTTTFKDNDFGVPPGTKSADVWKFTGCRKVGCKSVKVDRQGGTANAHYKSTLRKVKRGVYKGTEGPYPYSCPGVNNSTFTAAHTIRITKAKNGKATQVSGSSKVKITNCQFKFVNYALSGKLR